MNLKPVMARKGAISYCRPSLHLYAPVWLDNDAKNSKYDLRANDGWMFHTIFQWS